MDDDRAVRWLDGTTTEHTREDVMRAGGWRNVKALQTAYQSADPETVRRVMDMA